MLDIKKLFLKELNQNFNQKDGWKAKTTDTIKVGTAIKIMKSLVCQLEPQVSLRLRHKYSGEDSKLFWKLINAMGERQQEFYSLGVVLQNLEGWILTQMKYEAPNFVEDEQASN